MSVDFLSFFISLPLSMPQVFSITTLSWYVYLYVWMCEHAYVCMWFHWDLRKHCCNYQRNLQQCHVSLSFSDPLMCYLQVVCVQLQMAYISLNLLCHSSFPWLAQSFLLFLYKLFVFSQGDWFTHQFGGGVRQRCQHAQWVKGEKNLRWEQRVVAPYWKRWLTWVDSGCIGT